MQRLNSIANEAYQRNFGNRPAARRDIERGIRNERDFDWANASVLAEQYERARACGAILRLDDPRLKGQPRRPLTLDESW
jgi:hypothetical protein